MLNFIKPLNLRLKQGKIWHYFAITQQQSNENHLTKPQKAKIVVTCRFTISNVFFTCFEKMNKKI